jgi:hypothetical protein
VENWWYARNRPSGDAPAPGNVPTAVAAPQPPSAPDPRGARPPSLPLLRGVPPLADEATWVPDAGAGGTPAGLYTGFFRPDAAYPAQIVGVAWMAVFNSSWKMRDSRGGFYTTGRPVVPLKDGAALLVIDASGRVTVGRWGQDVRMGPQVAAVRQNLALIVDNGRPVAGLAVNADGSWGSPKNQFQSTWRSGLGVGPWPSTAMIGACPRHDRMVRGYRRHRARRPATCSDRGRERRCRPAWLSPRGGGATPRHRHRRGMHLGPGGGARPTFDVAPPAGPGAGRADGADDR